MKGAQTFCKDQRILNSREYSLIWQKGQRYHTSNFVFIVLPDSVSTRLGMTISRKVGNAVCRNRLKRWIREFFRCNHNQLLRNVCISVIAKRQAGQLSHPQVALEFQTLFARLETEDYV